MAIQPDRSLDGGGHEGPRWDAVFTPSELANGVFDVRWDVRPRLRRWLAEQDLPAASGREIHLPAIDAWALLDGGVIAVSAVTLPGHSPGAVAPPGRAASAGLAPTPPSPLLTPGMRVLGHRALRLLIARLRLPGPAHALLGGEHDGSAQPGSPDVPWPADPAAAAEQAELLASCTDRSTLRWVAAALRA